MVTAAQVYYITKVYPETVTDEESRTEYEKNICTPANRLYWETVAKIINNLCNKEKSVLTLDSLKELHKKVTDILDEHCGTLFHREDEIQEMKQAINQEFSNLDKKVSGAMIGKSHTRRILENYDEEVF